MTAIKENPKLQTPFDHGWLRELVQRAGSDGSSGIRADAYYFSPGGKKLRSIKEMENYLREIGSPLEVSCFSFTRHLLGVGPPFEKLRMARVTGPGSAAAGHRKTPAAATAKKIKAAAAKKIQRKKQTVTIGSASSVIQIASPTSANPPKLPRKHSLMEKSRKLFAFKAMELKKKMPVFQSDAKPPGGPRRPGRPAGSGRGRSRVSLRRPWLLTEVDDRGSVQCRQPPDPTATGEYLRLVRTPAAPHTADNVLIGRRRLSAPCSLFCFADVPLSLPSAQCLICRCLSHPACVGLEDPGLASFVCVDCYAGVSRGRGFDGVGDSADVDSGPDSGSDSDGDSVEELLPCPPSLPPPPPPPPLVLGGQPLIGAPPPLPPGVKRPRGRPRMFGPRQPRPGAVRGAYARRRGGGVGLGGARCVSLSPRLASPGLSPSAGTPTGGEMSPAVSSPGSTAAVPAALTVPPPAAGDAPAKKRSWKTPDS